MTHVWLTKQLHSAWASCLAVPELEVAIPAFEHMPRAHTSSTPESRLCPS